MSLMHAILGFLSYKPRTGYDLKTACFDESVAHFWPADQAQIYRTLDKLTEQGLVAFQPVPPHRDPFLVQLFFAADVPNAAILEQLRQQLAAHQATLEKYRRIEIPAPETMPTLEWKRRVSLQQSTLDAGLRYEQTEIEWLRDTIKRVEGLEEAGANPHP